MEFHGKLVFILYTRGRSSPGKLHTEAPPIEIVMNYKTGPDFRV